MTSTSQTTNVEATLNDQYRMYNKTLLDPVFDRQMRIPDWNQNLISQQVAFCLGVGGLGSTVATALCRLGIKKIFLLDYDNVDSHNLNRQVLYSKEHVGKNKVECAMQALKQHCVGDTELVPMNMNALTNWDKIVAAAKECTVIFNMIDIGDYWDLAVQSLCLKLKIPMVNGGTFRNTITADYCKPAKGCSCISCMSDYQNKEVVAKLQPELIMSYTVLDFLPKNENIIGASNCMIACACGHFMVDIWIQDLVPQKELTDPLPSRVIFYLSTFESTRWTVPPSEDCVLACETRK